MFDSDGHAGGSEYAAERFLKLILNPSRKRKSGGLKLVNIMQLQ